MFIAVPMAQRMRSDFFLKGPFIPPKMKMDRDPLGELAMFGQMPGSRIGTVPRVVKDRFFTHHGMSLFKSAFQWTCGTYHASHTVTIWRDGRGAYKKTD
jgi:hypothetical protein